MAETKKKPLRWLVDSHRLLHVAGGFVVGLLFTLLAALGAAGALEFKDHQWGGQWDWLDFAATLIGGALGQVVQVLIIWAVIA